MRHMSYLSVRTTDQRVPPRTCNFHREPRTTPRSKATIILGIALSTFLFPRRHPLLPPPSSHLVRQLCPAWLWKPTSSFICRGLSCLRRPAFRATLPRLPLTSSLRYVNPSLSSLPMRFATLLCLPTPLCLAAKVCLSDRLTTLSGYPLHPRPCRPPRQHRHPVFPRHRRSRRHPI